jgi:hypothetical protein
MPVQSALITPQEAELVWKSQARPSARTVANALTHAGRRVHFTTVARITIAKSSDPLASMQGVRTPDSAEHERGLAEDEGQKFHMIPCGGNDSQTSCPVGSHKKCPSVPSPTDGLFHAYSGDETDI